MINVLSKSAFTIALAGSLLVSGISSGEKNQHEKHSHDLSLAHHVGVTPELADQAKRLGVDLSKVDPAEKTANTGTKFQQAAITMLPIRKQPAMSQSLFSLQNIKMVMSRLVT